MLGMTTYLLLKIKKLLLHHFIHGKRGEKGRKHKPVNSFFKPPLKCLYLKWTFKSNALNNF